ncbi:uncharacterized protein ACRADG_006540 [Cochliomyia hominivorax]
MSSSHRIRRDDFDIESIETLHDRGNYKSRSSGSRTRSRSRKRSYSRRLDNGSRSRSRSVERNSRRHRRGRDSYSRSRSRSRSRGYSRRSERRHNDVSRRRDSRSRSYTRSKSRSRSRSQSYASKHQSDRYRHRRNDYEEKNRDNSRSRSRSRSSSHFRDFGTKSHRNEDHSPTKATRSSSSNTLSRVREEEEETNDSKDTYEENLEDLPLPQQKSNEKKSESIYHFAEDEPIDRERIHKEMEEKLRAELAKEGKVYPPPKPEASHPVFANDGSFLEIFKKMQEAQASTSTAAGIAAVGASTSNVKPLLPIVPPIVATANPSTAPYLAAAAIGKSAPPPPIVGRRRGGKILKTGVVAKPKIQTDANADPKDFWSLYLAEVNKYKNTACESDQGNRPLVK